MAESMGIAETFWIGENDHGYKFGAARIGSEWFGFALGDLEDGNKMMFFLSIESSADKDLIIRQTCAIARAAEHGYGGIKRWFIPEPKRAMPADFECKHCGSVGCDGECEDEVWDEYDQVCSVCGCTDTFGCPEGCYWVKENLCSQCAAREN